MSLLPNNAVRAWFSPLFIIALLISLLLHGVTAGGEVLVLWLQNEEMDATPVVKATQRKLQGQSLAAEPASLALLAGVTPAGNFQVSLAGPRAPIAAPAGKPAPTLRKSIKPTPAPVPVRRPDREELLPAPVADPSLPTPVVAQAETTAPVPVPALAPAAAKPVDAAPAQPGSGFPRSVNITYMVKGLISADHRWRIVGNRYEITTHASFAGKARDFRSEGEISPDGLKPHSFIEHRDRIPQPKYQVDFDWPAKTVQVGEPGERKTVPLEDGAQDVFSAAYQFALLGDRVPSFNLQILSGRKSYKMVFDVKGEVDMTLSGRKVTALLVAGAHEKRRFEFYLAPEWNNLPIRIRFDDDGSITDLVATQVEINGQVLLAKPERSSRDR
ncbi:DUF3108 domain-containing protein [Chitinimonas arctica]|uniref:DUF3108 domain-containing protein n=1 Tax=Chitinimonas arctica TaxID=2594795 RepID=A0A516SEB0_9NEIS|nr:DUF3108 domain-containing protein [Chitinimonas arctica]QDQ26473.1 DUF3108 domain-containing protein [Chitinimonas arctica]